MLKPGDVVINEFAGAVVTKRRPLVVVSSELYHRTRPDIIVGILTTRADRTGGPTDYILQDWRAAGLNAPSVFRSYLGTTGSAAVRVVGHLSERDWEEVQKRVGLALSAIMPDSRP